MHICNCEITEPKGWVNSADTCRMTVVTIGDVLKCAGYRCGIVGPWHLGDDHRPQHGFSDFWRTYRYLGDHPDPLFDYFETEGVENLYRSKAPGMTQYGNILEFGTITDPRQQRTTWTIDRSLDFIQQQDDDVPFFLFTSIKDPHPSYLSAARPTSTLS